MRLSYQGFWIQKEGNDPEEYEDAIAASEDKTCYAIADGATEASFSKEWAEILVQGFTDDPLLSLKLLEEWLKPLQEKWHQLIDWENLPWHAEEKARYGAFSTFLGLKFVSYPPDVWKRIKILGYVIVIAIGDACLFVIRQNKLFTKFPIENSEDFSNSPPLLSSLQGKNEDFEIGSDANWIPMKENDLFFLMTDALSQWLLKQYENGEESWEILERINTQDDFIEFIGGLRREKSINNDDTTLLVIRVSA